DLFGEPKRMIKRERVHERAEAQALRPLRDGGEKDARRRRHAERRRVVLSEMIGMEARAIISLDELQPLLILLVQGKRALIHVIEDAEFQAHRKIFRSVGMAEGAKTRLGSRRFELPNLDLAGMPTGFPEVPSHLHAKPRHARAPPRLFKPDRH